MDEGEENSLMMCKKRKAKKVPAGIFNLTVLFSFFFPPIFRERPLARNMSLYNDMLLGPEQQQQLKAGPDVPNNC